MRKKLAIIILFALLLASCGEGEKVPSGALEAADIELTISGDVYEVDKDITNYTDKLGDDFTYSEAISCAYDGLDKTFDYTALGISFYTRPEGGRDLVGEIFADSNTDAETPRGIKIGSKRSEVESAYGAPQQRTSLMYGYTILVSDVANSPASVYFHFDSNDRVVAVGITAEQLSGE